MNKKTYLLIAAIAAVASLVSGVLTQLFTPSAVRAQWSNVIKADQFRLVDSRGVDRARLGLSGGNQEITYLYLMDRNGKNRMNITVYPDNRTPTIEFLNRNETRVVKLPGRPSRSGSVRPVKKIRIPRSRASGRGGGKADQLTARDLDAIETQLDLLRETVNKLTALH